jgi:hypothetical protein
MEIRFKAVDNDRPVYDFGVKQEWEKHVYYECPAKLTEAELKAMEKIARATFWALDCRDVARVDLRMDAEGRIYVLEVNPLPGLTPDYSDLVLITKAIGIEYDQLIAEIMVGGLRRMREKRREERELEREREAAQNTKSLAEVGSRADKDKADKKRTAGAKLDAKLEKLEKLEAKLEGGKPERAEKAEREAKGSGATAAPTSSPSISPPADSATPVRVKRERSEPVAGESRAESASDATDSGGTVNPTTN